SSIMLEAQKASVLAFINGKAELVAEFTEVESGKHADREELKKAIAACKKHKAKLVIAKLDRLSRNLAFIATLMESGVEFVAVDMPEANKLTVHTPTIRRLLFTPVWPAPQAPLAPFLMPIKRTVWTG